MVTQPEAIAASLDQMLEQMGFPRIPGRARSRAPHTA